MQKLIMETKLVSVIVPCYNQADYLGETLECVKNQTYSAWECIIINDGSTDHTAIIADDWCAKDARFKHLNIKNNGVSNARNTGILASNGFYILPLDGDDKISENYIENLVEAFESGENVKVAYGTAYKFGAVNEKWELSKYSFNELLFSNMIHCSGLFKKTDFLLLPDGYDIKMHEGLEDWEFWINFLKDGGEAICVDSAIFYYRIKKESRMTEISLPHRYRLLAYIYHKFPELYEPYIVSGDPKMKLDFPYSFYLSAKTYTPDDTEKIERFRKFYEDRLTKYLKKYSFATKKKLLFNWYQRKKLNFSFWDFLLK
jgi:glycosyltransferase involved in cell wall biosynthesis